MNDKKKSKSFLGKIFFIFNKTFPIFAICFFVLLSITSFAKPINKLLFPGRFSSNDLKERSGIIVSLKKKGRKVVAFTAEFRNRQGIKSISAHCNEVKIFRLSFNGDLIEKKPASCEQLQGGMWIKAIFDKGNLKTILLFSEKGAYEE